MNRKNKICLVIILACVLLNGILWGLPIVNEYMCKTRIHEDMENCLTDTVLSANVRILIRMTEEVGNVSSYHYGEIGSGVIFETDENSYYVLTAAHVVDGKTEFETNITIESDAESILAKEYAIVPYGSPTYNQARKESKDHVPTDEFYEQYPSAEVEYISEYCDIAVLRFSFDEEYGCLNLADADPVKDDRIIVFGKDNDGSVVRYGRILSGEYANFDAHDGREPDRVLKHNAYEAPGYSGGAVLNEGLEIVGINIGGGTNAMGKFRYGVMVPRNLIAQVISDWREYKSLTLVE